MTNDLMTKEERGLTDKLAFFYSENIEVHLKMNRQLSDGRHIFFNGFLKARNNEKVWEFDERKLGNIRVAISEIKEVEEVRL